MAQFLKELLPAARPLSVSFNQRLQSSSTLLPSSSHARPPWGRIGTATDYRLRYYFGIAPTEELVAAKGAKRLRAYLPGEGPSDASAPDPTGNFFRSLERVLTAPSPVKQRLNTIAEERLCRYCFVLALFESIGRGQEPAVASPLWEFRPLFKTDELLAYVEQQWAEDLRQISWLFFDRHSALLSGRVVLNPKFSGSADIGGADADLIIDGCLIDIKTTKDPKLDTKWLHQLLGYVLLDYDDTYGIDAIGIYLPRQGELIRWPLTPFLSTYTSEPATTLVELRTRFHRLLTENRRASARGVFPEDIASLIEPEPGPPMGGTPRLTGP